MLYVCVCVGTGQLDHLYTDRGMYSVIYNVLCVLRGGRYSYNNLKNVCLYGTLLTVLTISLYLIIIILQLIRFTAVKEVRIH